MVRRPLYTVQTVFNPGDPHPVKVSEDRILGVISMPPSTSSRPANAP
jgi:K+ transporter